MNGQPEFGDLDRIKEHKRREREAAKAEVARRRAPELARAKAEVKERLRREREAAKAEVKERKRRELEEAKAAGRLIVDQPRGLTVTKP